MSLVILIARDFCLFSAATLALYRPSLFKVFIAASLITKSMRGSQPATWLSCFYVVSFNAISRGEWLTAQVAMSC
jgi:hypothetical protein